MQEVNEDQLVGPFVGDKFSNFKGKVLKIIGCLATEWSRLMRLTKRNFCIRQRRGVDFRKSLRWMKSVPCVPVDSVLWPDLIFR